MAYGAFEQSGKGSASKRRFRPTPASCGIARGSAALVAHVRTLRASSLSIPAGGLPSRSSGGSYRGHGAGHIETSATHGSTVTEARKKQRLDHGSDRYRCIERVSGCSEETWLSRVLRADHFKSKFPIRLIACSSPSLPRPTIFWCPVASARSVGA
jgi:hypothetical protein